MIGTVANTEITTWPTVLTCYELLDLALRTGIRDFTEGIYQGNPNTGYEEAQRAQAEHLLDLADCHTGSRLLDIGCGYGRILEAAQCRRASALGITISPAQVDYCRAKGLDVRLLDYRQVPDTWAGRFDCIVANGSLEHFVQPHDAAEGRADEIYRELFAICHRLLDPRSDGGRLVTTAIHFGSVHIDPRAMLRPSRGHRRGSHEHHYALLVHGFGGFYPSIGQLEQCASGYFVLSAEEDGTDDYRLTAEHWLREMKRAFRSNARFVLGVVGMLVKHPHQALTLLDCLLFAQSWNWQFRGAHPPMRLLRQTWQPSSRVARASGMWQVKDQPPLLLPLETRRSHLPLTRVRAR